MRERESKSNNNESGKTDRQFHNQTYEVILAHGWNKGHIKEREVISTIDSGVNKWHTLLGTSKQ